MAIFFSFLLEVHEPYNANDQTRYIELTMVIGNGIFRKLDSDFNKVHQFCKDIAKHVNVLYSPLNIFVALTGVEIWNEFNQAEITK